jgi:hypothetical protein
MVALGLYHLESGPEIPGEGLLAPIVVSHDQGEEGRNTPVHHRKKFGVLPPLLSSRVLWLETCAEMCSTWC